MIVPATYLGASPVTTPATLLAACAAVFTDRGTIGDIRTLVNAGARVAIAMEEFGEGGVKATSQIYRDDLLILLDPIAGMKDSDSALNVDYMQSALCMRLDSVHKLAQVITHPTVQTRLQDLNETLQAVHRGVTTRFKKWPLIAVGVGTVLLGGLALTIWRLKR